MPCFLDFDKQQLVHRDRLKNLAIRTNAEGDWKNYKDTKNICNNKIKKTKIDYYQNTFQQNLGNSKEIWKSINELMSRNSTSKSENITSLKYNDRVISDPAEISESFNKHFSEVGLKLSTSIFPDDWKVARVRPIHKGEAKDDANNYRPISVLSAISKIFERIIHDQLYYYLNENNLLSENQSR